MSTTTPNLGLFKYNTTEDANTPFSINTALNNNWDIIDNKILNPDLSNLTDAGNAKLQYAPFAINDGTVTNGENKTLYCPTEPVSEWVSWTNPHVTSLTEYGTMTVSGFGGDWVNLFDGNTTTGSVCTLAAPTITWAFPDRIKISTIAVSCSFVSGTNTDMGNCTVYGTVNGIETNFGSTGVFGRTTLDTKIINFNNTEVSAIKIVFANGSGSYPSKAVEIAINGQIYQTIATGTDLISNPCTITTADGRTKSFENSSVIDCSSLADGTYRVLKDYETGQLSTVSNIAISKTTPATPASGDCWLDISTIPANFKTYNGSSWVTDNDKVYLGNVKVSSGVITKVTNNVFNQFYSDEIIRINTDLDFSNVITVSTTNSTSSQNYTCLSDGVLFVSAHSYSSSSSSKDVRALVYYDEENETTSNGNYLIGSATQLLARVSRSCLKGEKVYFLINATGGTNTCYAKFVPYKK